MNPEALYQTLSLLERFDADDLRALLLHLSNRMDTDDMLAAFARRGNLRGMRLLKKTGQRGGGVLTRVILDVPLTRANRESDLLSRAEALQRLAGELSSDPPRRARQPSKKNTLPGANPDDPHNLKPLISRYAPAKPTRPTSAS